MKWQSEYETEKAHGRSWLAASRDRPWQDVARESSTPMDGKRMRQVWGIITGSDSAAKLPEMGRLS